MKQTQILKKPLITEKSLALAALGRYSFGVDPEATKTEISQAIEKAFGVHVVSLKTIVLKGKTRRSGSRRREIVTRIRKKAIVRLAPEEKIDLFTVPGQEEAKTK